MCFGFRIFVSETYTLHDYYLYDDATTDKHNNWTVISGNDTITYDSTNHHYRFTKSSNGDTFVTLTDNIVPNECKIEFDIRLVQGDNTQPRIGLRYNNYFFGASVIIDKWGTKSIRISKYTNDWAHGSSVNCTIANNNWYHVELTLSNGTATMNLYNGSTLLGTTSMSVTDVIGSMNKFHIDSSYSSNSIWDLKNISVEAL